MRGFYQLLQVKDLSSNLLVFRQYYFIPDFLLEKMEKSKEEKEEIKGSNFYVSNKKDYLGKFLTVMYYVWL